MNGKPTVISTFSGCGGSSLGYKLAGFKELLAIDYDTNSVEVFKLNFPDIPVWQRDITEVKSREILDFCNIKVGELDVLDGSPPCQGFSTAGKRQVLDPRNRLFESFVFLVSELQPKVFVMENVSGQIKGPMKGLFKEILLELKSLNYTVKVKLMNAKYYQVPQSRERLIYIGVRNDLKLKPSFPQACLKTISVSTILKDVINSEEELIEARKIPEYIKPILKKIKTGENGTKYKLGTYFNIKRTYWNQPGLTIVKTPDTFHSFEDRYLTRIELKRISSFPDDFQFIGDLRMVYNRIGNAVMPNMMKAIALNIKENILI